MEGAGGAHGKSMAAKMGVADVVRFDRKCFRDNFANVAVTIFK